MFAFPTNAGITGAWKDLEDTMPKLKTNRGAAKRFRVTGSGKFARARANKGHILAKRTTKRKRQLRQSTLVDAANVTAVRRMLPYL